MQETSEWDRLTPRCAALREPPAQITSFVEGSVAVMLLSGTGNFFNSRSAAGNFSVPSARPRSRAARPVLFNHKSAVFFFLSPPPSSPLLSAAHLTVVLSLINTAVEEPPDAAFFSS